MNVSQAKEKGSLPSNSYGATPPLRLDFLDGIRGLAALYVAMHHAYLEVAWTEAKTGEILSGTLEKCLHPLLFGNVGVDVFIVLSGFCLTLPIAKKSDFSLRGGIKRYLARRGRRILPPYYAALIFSLLLIALGPGMSERSGARWDVSLPAYSPEALLSHLLLVQNVSPEWSFKIDYPMWSVAVEWQIYFIFPLLLLPVLRRFGLVATAFVGFVVGLVPVYLARHHAFPSRFELSCPWLLGVFTMGMVSALLVFSERFANGALGRSLGKGWLFACAFFFWAARADFWQSRGWNGEIVIGIWAALLLAYGAKQYEMKRTSCIVKLSLPVRALESSIPLWLGSISYSLYLVHAPILAFVHALVRPMHMSGSAVIGVELAAGIPFSLAVAAFFQRWFERPFQA